MKNSRTLASLAAAVLVAGACSDAPTSTAPAAEDADQQLRKQVEALGFRGDMVEDFGDYVVVEGDIRLSKAQLLTARQAPAGGAMGPRFQFSTTALVGSPKVHQIRVDVTGLAAEPDWQNAARTAIGLWSQVPNSYIQIVEGSPADITFALGCLAWNWAAQASWPAGGDPGPTITVNRDNCIGFGLNNQQRLQNMVHEIGHTLGFRHTNWSALNEQNDPAHTQIGAVHIPGTPGTGGDPGSVMNGGMALNAWAGFSANDQLAARTLYPLPVPSLAVAYVSGQPYLTWPSIVGATFVVHRKYSSQGQDEFGWFTGDGSAGTISNVSSPFTDTGWTYTGNQTCYWDQGSGYWLEKGYWYTLEAQFPTGSTFSYANAEVGDC